MAYMYTILGKNDKAIDMLEKVLSVPFDKMSVATLKLNPHWDPLRDHPRFKALIEKYSN